MIPSNAHSSEPTEAEHLERVVRGFYQLRGLAADMRKAADRIRQRMISASGSIPMPISTLPGLADELEPE